MESTLTYDQLRSAEETFRVLFEEVMAEAPAIVGLAQEVSNDAIDVRTLLRAVIQGADHVKTKQPLKNAADNYEKLIDILIECAKRAEALIALAKRERYHERLKQFSPIPTPDFKTEEGKRLIFAIFRINGLLSSRHFTWAFAFKNFFNVLRSIDTAQSLLLDQLSRLDPWKRVAKAIAADTFGTAVPLLATLVALAEHQTVEIDKRLDALRQATGELDRVFKFEDIVLHCIELSEFVTQIMEQARTDEVRFMEVFEEEFPARGP